jgi:hypothetical protein
MINEPRDKPAMDWGKIIGWGVFGLVLLAGPLSGIVRRIFGASLPPQLFSWLPMIIGGLVVLSFVISAVRAITPKRSETTPLTGENAFPTVPRLPSTPPVMTRSAKPKVSQTFSSRRLPNTTFNMAPPPLVGKLPQTPQFEPLFSPVAVIVGIVGLAGLAGVGFILWLIETP